jgi:hypothetical protein
MVLWYNGTMVLFSFVTRKNASIFLCISKLNRNFDYVEGTPFWMYKKKCEHFSCVSQNLIVPLHLTTL